MIAALALCTLFSHGAASAATVESELEPFTDWLVKADEASCRLLRSFGSAEAPTHLSIEFYAPGHPIQLRIAGEPVAQGKKDVAFRFYPGGEVLQERVIRRQLDDGVPMITAPNMFADLSPARRLEVEWLDTKIASGENFRLHLGPLAAPLAQVDDCLNQLFAGWGVDLAQQEKLQRKAEPATPPTEWINSQVYPLVPLLNAADGRVHFLLVVGASGDPVSCQIQNSSGPKQFRDATCAALMQRAHFQPALDFAGKPIVSYFRTVVRFEAEG
jgi:hypothetical protein